MGREKEEEEVEEGSYVGGGDTTEKTIAIVWTGLFWNAENGATERRRWVVQLSSAPPLMHQASSHLVERSSLG